MALPLHASATNAEPVVNNEPKTETPAAVTAMMERLVVIKNIDKSNMSRSEKRTLRREVKSINKAISASNGGVYLSVGAIILIAVLLVILL